MKKVVKLSKSTLGGPTLDKAPLKANLKRQQNLSIKQKLLEPKALGTVEIVLIIAILIAVALIFREAISNFAKDLIAKVFDHSIIDQVTYD